MVIKSAKYVISSPDYEHCPAPDRPEYAFIGRSNVGKSSLINMISYHQKLAKTSATPGKTQLINHFAIESNTGKNTASGKPQSWYLVDLPGYGFAKVSMSSRKKWEKMISDYLKQRKNLVNVFVLIDGRHDPQKIDLEFVNKMGEWEVPFCLVFTKADKETQLTVSRNVKSFLQAMRKTWQFLPRHFVTSTIKNRGREEILDWISELNEEFVSE
ncbi:MAG: YihA family ribosome biogenesis GTP-binding protein [Bacteroidetes bacterium]|nr:MAG: YihA family ribosome biogenesis GTP-binding protein [Bacteroidota bacterium]